MFCFVLNYLQYGFSNQVSEVREAITLQNSGPTMEGLHILNNEQTSKQTETTLSTPGIALCIPSSLERSSQAPSLQSLSPVLQPNTTWFQALLQDMPISVSANSNPI